MNKKSKPPYNSKSSSSKRGRPRSGGDRSRRDGYKGGSDRSIQAIPSIEVDDSLGFADLGLDKDMLESVSDLGYEKPSPIQIASIPPLLEGSDILGQAQTGTGKTAAFALPLLSNVTPKDKYTQLLVLAPTRELAIQVAEACQQYARKLKGLMVLPIYGGQSYTIQLRQLNRGAQVVVGTPGRVMDHIRRGTLKLDKLRAVVLDEADEMLKMGFIDDVKWVLDQAPEEKQIALFSATMPTEIKKVTEQYLRDPVLIRIASKTATAANIEQRYWVVKGIHKLDAITRILESEETDGVIVFVRTKNASVELSDKLSARGFNSEALNGDIPQANREKIITRLKKSKLDILVATDVAARGLDVDRVSHVINYDVPHDTESYVHRIGRTGRAGRLGKTILFITPREKRMLSFIERATKQEITAMQMPTLSDINASRVERFKQRLVETVENEDIGFYSEIIAALQMEKELSAAQLAAAAAYLLSGSSSLLLDSKAKEVDVNEQERRDSRPRQSEHKPRSQRSKAPPAVKATPLIDFPDIEMARFKLAVGRNDNVKPSNIVGAIANEAELESKYIGEIEIREDYSTVDLPADMPKGILSILRKARITGKASMIEPYKGDVATREEGGSRSRGGPDQVDHKRPGKKSYSSKGKKDKSGKGKSEYAKKKQKERKKKKD